jgi:hypothetical protein
MTTDATTRATSKAMLWTGRVISAIPILMMGGMGLVMLIAFPEKVTEGMAKHGYPPGVAKPILIVEIVCAVIYLIPQTAVLGAILLSGYLGGAVATHVHAGEPFWFPILFGVLVWLGLLLRDARIRELLPLRR